MSSVNMQAPSHGSHARPAVIEYGLDVPSTLAEALEPAWLEQALAPVTDGAKIRSVRLTEVIKTVASKARVAVEFHGEPGVEHAYCVKAFLDFEDPATGGATTIREADFYAQVAPMISMRVPTTRSVVLDREKQTGILVMDDLVAAGTCFFSALDPCDFALALSSLDQLARLHARTDLAAQLPWLSSRIDDLVRNPYLSLNVLDELLARPRRTARLSAQLRDGALLHRSLEKLAQLSERRPQTILHGDTHAGNLFITPEGPGFADWQMVQRGFWALDVAYHINTVLTIEMSERHERDLLAAYLDALRRHGGPALDFQSAWTDYKMAMAYGFYQWAVTRFVKEEITETCVQRMGAAMDRHQTYRLLGVV